MTAPTPAPAWDEAAALEAMARSIGDADDDWPYRTYRTTEDIGQKPHTLAHAALTALAPLLAARDAAAIARIRALEAERERLLAIVSEGQGAVNAAIEQAQAEYQGHDKRAERFGRAVDAWRTAARRALAQAAEPPSDE